MASFLSRTGKRCEGYSSATFRYRESRSRLAISQGLQRPETMDAELFLRRQTIL